MAVVLRTSPSTGQHPTRELLPLAFPAAASLQVHIATPVVGPLCN